VRFLASRGLPLRGQRVLDLGGGFGGYSLALRNSGAWVVGADLSLSGWPESVEWVRANALAVPLRSGSVDAVVCASLIEHVPDPVVLVCEIHRVLKTGGWAYLSFPPFYTPVGGHQFSPFHLLGERAALGAIRLRKLYRGKGWLQEQYSIAPASFSCAWGDWGLYPLTIHRVQSILKAFPFQLLERSTRWLPVDFSGVPILGEFLTWHVQFLLVKRDT